MEFINMNDMSMLYKMLGCVSLSNNKQPYTLCKCDKRVAVSNPNHVCNLITDNEQQEWLIYYVTCRIQKVRPIIGWKQEEGKDKNLVYE